jgi:hypothetical protein
VSPLALRGGHVRQALNAQLHDWPNPGLKEVIAIDKDGNLLHLYP